MAQILKLDVDLMSLISSVAPVCNIRVLINFLLTIKIESLNILFQIAQSFIIILHISYEIVD